MIADDTSNPFSTRFVRPGALNYRFDGSDGSNQLTATLRRLQWQAQIIGPHGSGKSTLLCDLVPCMRRAQRDIRMFTLHAGQHRLPITLSQVAWQATTQVIIDGYEQLHWRARHALKAKCRKARCGLLVTAHQCVGLPTLVQTRPSIQIVQDLVEDLTRGRPPLVQPGDVARCFEAHQGNVREVLFALYDLYERRRHNH